MYLSLCDLALMSVSGLRFAGMYATKSLVVSIPALDSQKRVICLLAAGFYSRYLRKDLPVPCHHYFFFGKLFPKA